MSPGSETDSIAMITGRARAMALGSAEYSARCPRPLSAEASSSVVEKTTAAWAEIGA